MRIFPAGTRDAMEPVGQAMIILAACMLLIAIVVFGFKSWILYSWPRVDGIVISSHVETMTSDDGALMCSAVELVQYAVDGQQKVIQTGGPSFTSDCKAIEARVAAGRGQSRIVVYNRHAPGATYVNPGFTIEFYLIAVVLTFLAGAFGLAGWIGIKVYRWTVKRDIDLP